MKEAKDSSSRVYKITLLLSDSISTTPQQVSQPQAKGRRFLYIHTYSSTSFSSPSKRQKIPPIHTYSSVSFSSPRKRQKIPPHTYLLLSEFLILKQEAKDSSPYIPTPQWVVTTPSRSKIKTTRAHILQELNM